MDSTRKEKGNFMYNRDVHDFFSFEVGARPLSFGRIIYTLRFFVFCFLKHNDKVYSQLFYLQHNTANESVSIFPVFPYTCKST